ncbi:hypothetical protein ASPZODRAFT_63428 [Penicilliopsis zonata CBS 506.65]|uniref:F-box domain-containing protein n=1 Tax=Penicilliopsis zonata CBS 506.65 TaxID=1073090 RepID=A0A1L9SLA9_9EURO|nr:hypothetical protein ASPZODRAFT_63428 [Penicilliopsis zonata CBS 506.65]OJJ47999.1 hypothetical protein ASPZODRAFT_63428 [Penicilliopsis zonata CBS 506.65]
MGDADETAVPGETAIIPQSVEDDRTDTRPLAATNRVHEGGGGDVNGVPVGRDDANNAAVKSLQLLDLPMDILKDIVKEITHTNDLTSLALTCSTLHALAIPNMYSRFDIVWPETQTTSESHNGVDALSYGLATLVMGEDVFHEGPRSTIPCPCCGYKDRGDQQSRSAASGLRHVRRGNYYAQYTRKFSVGNGPLMWVQEYAVTKETGKMLGTLVALAVVRMLNLETFIWDMPTGVLRDVWIALASLADRPGHDCRLDTVWVRWHDNSENVLRSLSNGPLPAPGGLSMHPVTNPTSSSSSSSSSMPTSSSLQKYAHVEYPSLSMLPALKSLTVLDIDEPSYLDEMAVLIQRSYSKLKELRIGISAKAAKADWLKPLANWAYSDEHQQPSPPVDNGSGWPKLAGALEVLLVKFEGLDRSTGEVGRLENALAGVQMTTELDHQDLLSAQGQEGVIDRPNQPSGTEDAENSQTEGSQGQQSLSIEGQGMGLSSQQIQTTLKKSRRLISGSAAHPAYVQLKLETLELERVSLCVSFTFLVVDWTRITTLTILRCENHEKLWRALRRRFLPSAAFSRHPKKGTMGADSSISPSEYALKIKNLHTDAVSPPLLSFLKDSIAPNTLESVFLQEGPAYDSVVSIDAIYRSIIRKHRLSLKKILVDSAERSSTTGMEIVNNTRWRKWMFPREMISFITSGRMPQLRELGMAIHYKDWHFFLQRLPYIPHLRALYVTHMGHLIHRDPKELVLQILDIITIRPEVGLGYVGVHSKCYEILESKRGDKDDDSDDPDDPQSEALHPDPSGSGYEDEEENDSDDSPSEVGSEEVSVAERSSSEDDEDDEDDEHAADAKRASFRLREILFYDDKISIFKVRHGVL